jgi:hypothetical protein
MFLKSGQARPPTNAHVPRGEIALLLVQVNCLARKGLFLVRGRARVKSEYLGQIEQSIA